jgi:hypothetical protein
MPHCDWLMKNFLLHICSKLEYFNSTTNMIKKKQNKFWTFQKSLHGTTELLRQLARCEVLTSVLLKIQVCQNVTLSAWWAVLKWCGAFILKVKHSQKNASFLDSLTQKMTLRSFKHCVFLVQKYNAISQTTWIFYKTTPLTCFSLHHYEWKLWQMTANTFINNTNHLVWMLSSYIHIFNTICCHIPTCTRQFPHFSEQMLGQTCWQGRILLHLLLHWYISGSM